MSRLIIELLAIEKGKAYGYQEFAFNLLDYFYMSYQEIMFDNIILIVDKRQKKLFQRYNDRFQIIGYSFKGVLGRSLVQSMFPFWLRLGKKDLLFSPGNYSGIFKLCPTILTVHDLLFKRKKWLPNKFMRWHRQLYIPISLYHADKIVAISKFTATDIVHYYPHQSKGKVEVVRNYFNFAKFGTTPTKERGDYFIAVSSNGYHKNLITVIKAFEGYVKRGGEKKLVLVGNIAPNSEAGMAVAAMPSTVKDLLYVKTQVSNEVLGELYQKAGCYITASLFEGLGMPIVEAMYFNLPVLLTDDEVFREVSLGLGEYFNPHNVGELAEKMLNCDMCKRDYSELVKEAYSEENTSAKYIELINRVGGRI